MINKLKEINKKLIKINNNNKKELQKHLLIQKLLEDKDCFEKIPIETAYNILKDIQIPEDTIKETYIKLQEEERWKN